MGGAVSVSTASALPRSRLLGKDKMDAIREFKNRVDPRVTYSTPPSSRSVSFPCVPFTFSFNRLIEDIRQSGLPDKDRLISLLASVQILHPLRQMQAGVLPDDVPGMLYHFHPGTRTWCSGRSSEAIYYSQINKGAAGPSILAELRAMMEHCTGCGRCTSVCPVNPPADVGVAAPRLP